MYGWGGVVSFVGFFVLCSISGDISPLLFVVPLVLLYINILLLLAVQKKKMGTLFSPCGIGRTSITMSQMFN